MQDRNSALSCNSCHAHVDGIAYRTSCLHLLCPACAKHSFADGHTCAICSTVLSKELENFVSTQLLFETASAQESTIKALRENEDMSNQLTSSSNIMRDNEESNARNQADLDNLLRCREKEMSELKDAYKEKMRKCQAWEKAYNNIRDQIVVPIGRESINNEQQRHPIQQHPQSYPILQHNIPHARTDVTPPSHTPQDLISPPSKYYRSNSANRSVIPTGRQPKPQSHLTPRPSAYDDNPNQTVRRTEVTTYSRSLVPDSHYKEHHSQQPFLRQEQPLQKEHHRIAASSRPKSGPYSSSYTLPQQLQNQQLQTGHASYAPESQQRVNSAGSSRPTSGPYSSSYTSPPQLQNQQLQTGHASYAPQSQQRAQNYGVPETQQNRDLNKRPRTDLFPVRPNTPIRRQRTETFPARPNTPLMGTEYERITPPNRGGGAFFDRG